ncbi:MAG: TIR domain-containing protein [Pseudomonadota bacterium]
MKLFISWSGPVSQSIANEMRNWFPLLLPAVSPFITSTDIDKGAQWQSTIRTELEKSDYGIVILTKENLESQWLAFEAGALSKHLGGRVATVLFNIGHSDVKSPLSMFQGTIFNEADFRQLISDINKAVSSENRRGEDQLDQLYPMLWPRIKDPVGLILRQAADAAPQPATPPVIDQSAQLQEILALLRQQNALLSAERLVVPTDSKEDLTEHTLRNAMLRAAKNQTTIEVLARALGVDPTKVSDHKPREDDKE